MNGKITVVEYRLLSMSQQSILLGFDNCQFNSIPFIHDDSYIASHNILLMILSNPVRFDLTISTIWHLTSCIEYGKKKQKTYRLISHLIYKILNVQRYTARLCLLRQYGLYSVLR